MKLRTKLGLITLFLGFIFFSNINFTLAVEPLKLQVPIPGGKSEISFNATTKPIGEYIQWLYSYAISIVGIVATIMLMFGGFTWLTAGGSGEKVGKARDIIFGSLTGLALALTSYTILTLINPDLVNFSIQKINSPHVNGDVGATGGTISCIKDSNGKLSCPDGSKCNLISNTCLISPSDTSEDGVCAKCASYDNTGKCIGGIQCSVFIKRSNCAPGKWLGANKSLIDSECAHGYYKDHYEIISGSIYE